MAPMTITHPANMPKQEREAAGLEETAGMAEPGIAAGAGAAGVGAAAGGAGGGVGGGGSAPTAAPHASQNRTSLSFAPHFVQNLTAPDMAVSSYW